MSMPDFGARRPHLRVPPRPLGVSHRNVLHAHPCMTHTKLMRNCAAYGPGVGMQAVLAASLSILFSPYFWG